jgi:hypothetical protein
VIQLRLTLQIIFTIFLKIKTYKHHYFVEKPKTKQDVAKTKKNEQPTDKQGAKLEANQQVADKGEQQQVNMQLVEHKKPRGRPKGWRKGIDLKLYSHFLIANINNTFQRINTYCTNMKTFLC